MNDIKQLVTKIVKELFDVEVSAELTRPSEQFGDYMTNVAFRLAQQLNKNPKQVAEDISKKLSHKLVKKAEVAGAGFINITLSDEAIVELMSRTPSVGLKGKVIVIEYSDPNPFKVLHAGHLYQTVVGDSIANLLETAGARVHRVNFGGDVGLHVGKTLWAIIDTLSGGSGDEKRALTKLEAIGAKSLEERSVWLAEQYIKGSKAYEGDQKAKDAITSANKRVYEIHKSEDKESDFAKIYWQTRDWSYDYFKDFYDRIGSGFEKYYPESQTAPVGLEVVRQQLDKGVYEESQGAVVFRGEPFGLHTRVFINSDGLPTYETKDVGLAIVKWRDYRFDRTIIITGNDISEYMKVVLKSIEQFEPKIAERTTHLTHGQVKMLGGEKMSSRKGNILRAQSVIDSAEQANQKLSGKQQPDVTLGAIKYAFIKQTMGPDIIYNPEESVAIEGNSGPYLQYAHARARSIISKASVADAEIHDLTSEERSLARKLGEYHEVIDKSVEELSPHYLATYLFELTQNFNRFYEANRVIGDDRETTRLLLVKTYSNTLKNGLALLNISAPDKM